MIPSLPARAPLHGAALAIAVLLVAAACAAPSTDPATAGPPSGSRSPAASSAPTGTAVVGTPGPTADGPPSARLAAEGGDAVTGQPGSYVWDQTGSDSPWLPGSPIAVGAGEPLIVVLEPAIDVSAWRARYVPAPSSGPAGAVTLGEGVGPPRFSAPGPGSWTLALEVRFGEGRTASYAWRLDIP